ncbi:hypothetical protein Tco_0494850 [Tanacetum coccineum]
MSSFARCLIEVNSEADLADVVTIGIPSLSGDGFTKETIHVMTPPIVTTSNVVTPTIEETNDGFQMKRKGKSKSTNGGQFTSPSVKQNVRYKSKATTTTPKKGATYVGNTSQSSSMLKTTGNSSKKDNLSMSNSFSALYDEEEDVENVHDESANLIQNTKAGGSSSFMAAAGSIMGEVDINTLTMEQYVALTRRNQARGMVKPEIRGNVLDIVILFNIPGVSHDAIMLQNVHAFQVGCQTHGGAHLDKECPLDKEVKSVEEVKYGEFGRPFIGGNGAKYHVGLLGYYTHVNNRLPFGEKRPRLEKLMNKHIEESTRRRAEMEE